MLKVRSDDLLLIEPYARFHSTKRSKYESLFFFVLIGVDTSVKATALLLTRIVMDHIPKWTVQRYLKGKNRIYTMPLFEGSQFSL